VKMQFESESCFCWCSQR